MQNTKLMYNREDPFVKGSIVFALLKCRIMYEHFTIVSNGFRIGCDGRLLRVWSCALRVISTFCELSLGFNVIRDRTSKSIDRCRSLRKILCCI